MRAHTHTHNQQLYSKWNSAFAHAWVAERLPRQVYDLGEDPPRKADSELRGFFVRLRKHTLAGGSPGFAGAELGRPEPAHSLLRSCPGKGPSPIGDTANWKHMGPAWKAGPRGLRQSVGWLVGVGRLTNTGSLTHICTHKLTQAHTIRLTSCQLSLLH